MTATFVILETRGPSGPQGHGDPAQETAAGDKRHRTAFGGVSPWIPEAPPAETPSRLEDDEKIGRSGVDGRQRGAGANGSVSAIFVIPKPLRAEGLSRPKDDA